MELEKIKQVAEERLKNSRSHVWKELGNKYYHGERVARLALELRRRVIPGDDSHDDILTAAAWLHDIANGLSSDHAAEGARLVRGLIPDFCTPQELDGICSIISVHDDRSERRHGYSVWVKLHQDADHLDHFGSYDVWMVSLWTLQKGGSILDAADYLTRIRSSEMPRYRAELNFELSRRIFDEKAEYQFNFGRRLLIEGAGDIFVSDKLTDAENL